MTRRKNDVNLIEDLFEILKALPAWAGPLVAGAIYLLIGGILPAMLLSAGAGNPILQPMTLAIAGVIQSLAPVAGGCTLLLWLITLLSRTLDRDRLDKQTGRASIQDLSWSNFEKLLAEAFRRRGFKVQETAAAAGGGPDGGIDLILHRKGQRTLVQAKQWRTQKVGVKIVRELAGVVAAEKAHRGIVATSSTFTQEAQVFADRAGIQLINGQQLETIIRDVQRRPPAPIHNKQPTPHAATPQHPHPATVSTTYRPPTTPPPAPRPDAPQRSPPPTPRNQDTPPTCPDCAAPMVLRTAKRGPHPGQRFWGCSEYGPHRCKGTRPFEG